MSRMRTLVIATSLFMVSFLPADDELKSGPGAGKPIPGPFHPLTAHCPLWPDQVGKKHSFVEQYDDKPSVLIFTRGMSDPLTNLVKKIDAQLAQNKARAVRCLVVCLSDDNDQAAGLTEFGKQHALKHVDLAVDNVVGPRGYRIAMEAELTILLCAKYKVVANHAYRKGELNEKAIERLINEIDNKFSAGKQVKSGPQTGTNLPGPFHPLIIHCPQDPLHVGTRRDMGVEGFGARPVVMIFTRGLSDAHASLLKKVDAQLAQNKEMRGLVVWLATVDDELTEKLKGLAQRQRIKHLVFAIDDFAGPKAYNVAKDAELTIVLCDKRKVLANHAYRAGEFIDGTPVQRVINDIDDKLMSK